MEYRLKKCLTQLYVEQENNIPLSKHKVFESICIIQDLLRQYIAATKDSAYISKDRKNKSISRMKELIIELEKSKSVKSKDGLIEIDQVLHTMHDMDELSETIGYSLPKKVRDWLRQLE